MRVNLFSPRTARIFIVLILLLIACEYLGGRTVQYMSDFSSFVLTTYQHLAMPGNELEYLGLTHFLMANLSL